MLTIPGNSHTNVARAGKVMAPVSDDPELLPVVFQNVNLCPFHPALVDPPRNGGRRCVCGDVPQGRSPWSLSRMV